MVDSLDDLITNLVNRTHSSENVPYDFHKRRSSNKHFLKIMLTITFKDKNALRYAGICFAIRLIIFKKK